MKKIVLNDEEIALNQENFLIDRTQWSKQVAEKLAMLQDIVLTPIHWQVILFLRNFYDRYQLIPPLRILIKNLNAEYGENFANSIMMHKLFLDPPVKNVCRIAGLPKPKHCM